MGRWFVLFTALWACAESDGIWDVDGDGDAAIELEGTDCDDDNPNVHPGVEEICANGVDDDCNGIIDDVGFGEREWFADLDDDGWGSLRITHLSCEPPQGFVGRSGDCDDTRDDVHPTHPEICGNGIDEDCSGQADDTGPFVLWYPDEDGDGFGSIFDAINQCAPIFGRVTNNQDCDDSNPMVRPDAIDFPGDAADLNCDGIDG